MRLRAPLSCLGALLVTAAVATTAGCGGDDDKPDEARTASTSAQATTATSASTRPPATQGAKNDPAPGRVVQDYFNALSERDGDAACEHMGDKMKSAALRYVKTNLKQRSIKTCAAAVEKIVSPNTTADLRRIRNVEILSSRVEGISATVKVKRASRDALLTKIGGRWLITGGIFDG